MWAFAALLYFLSLQTEYIQVCDSWLDKQETGGRHTAFWEIINLRIEWHETNL